jgi:hypothetical protein
MLKPLNETVYLGPQRLVMAEMCSRILEMARDAYLPGVELGEAVELIFTVKKVYELQAKGRLATVSALSRAMHLPRATVYRRLTRLMQVGFVEKQGMRYVLSVARMNNPASVQSFKRRMAIVHETARKLSEMDA